MSPTIAFGVMAHKNLRQVEILISQLLSRKDTYVFLHIDAKAPFSIRDVQSRDRLVVIEQRLDASWGDISLVDIMLLILEEITSHDLGFEWVSIHSGMDLAVRPLDELAKFLSRSSKKGYIDSMAFPIKGWGRRGGLERVELVYPRFLRQRPKKHSLVRYVRFVYQFAYAHGLVRKRYSELAFRGGSQWFTLRGGVVSEMLDYLDSTPSYYAFFNNTLLPDETFFQTLLNTIYPSADNLFDYSNSLRYIDWSGDREAEVGAPATLIYRDTPKIEKSGKYFARKFDLDSDQKVVEYFVNKVDTKTRDGIN